MAAVGLYFLGGGGFCSKDTLDCDKMKWNNSSVDVVIPLDWEKGNTWRALPLLRPKFIICHTWTSDIYSYFLDQD